MLHAAPWLFVKETQIVILLIIVFRGSNQGEIFFDKHFPQTIGQFLVFYLALIVPHVYRISGAPRNEFRMARGGNSGDRARGALRGRAFKKTPIDRDSNTETSYYPAARPKFQESLKNQENSQGKYYDDKRING